VGFLENFFWFFLGELSGLFLGVLGGDRALEVTEHLTWGPGQSIRTSTFLFFPKAYPPNAVAPTELKKQLTNPITHQKPGFFKKPGFLKPPVTNCSTGLRT